MGIFRGLSRPSWGSQNTYEHLKELQLDMQQTFNSFINFVLLGVGVLENICQTGPFSAVGRQQNRFSPIALFFKIFFPTFFMNFLNSCQNQSILSPISLFFTKCPLGPTLGNYHYVLLKISMLKNTC